MVRVVGRNLKRWRPGDQLERWVGSGLLVAEAKFRRIDGFRALPFLLSILEGQAGPLRKAARAAEVEPGSRPNFNKETDILCTG